MGLFSTRRDVEATTKRSSLGNLFDAAGITGRASRAATPVTWDRALAMITVWACAQLRADLISSFPVDVFRRRVDGTSVEVTVPPVLREPSGELDDLAQWVWASQLSLDLRGNAYGLVSSRDRLNFPRTIELFHPDKVRCDRDRATGRPRYWFDGVEQDVADVWHEKAFVPPGGIKGMSPIAVAAASVQPVLAAQEHSASWFEDGAHPTQLLHYQGGGLTPEQARIAKSRYMASVHGSREPVVLDGNWDIKQLQMSAQDAMFLEERKFGVQEICRLFATPPELVGATSGNSLTYATLEGRSLDYLAYRLGPVIARRESHWSRHLLRTDEYVKLNVNALLRTDLKSRYAAYRIGIAASFLHPDEARDKEDLPPLTQEQWNDLQSIDISGPTEKIEETDA